MKGVLRTMRWIIVLLLAGVAGVSGYSAYQFYQHTVLEKRVLKEMVSRLQADSRIAEVVVTDVAFNSVTQQHVTTIKFLEYDVNGLPLQPRYFAFAGNIIQFQSLVIRFDDLLVRQGDALRGKSAYLFWKVFRLDGKETEEYDLTAIDTVPRGYTTDGPVNAVEQKLWERFWDYALDQNQAKIQGIKNAQVEAPGMKFVPGYLYTLRIEHDGGIRIDVTKIPEILRGEMR